MSGARVAICGDQTPVVLASANALVQHRCLRDKCAWGRTRLDWSRDLRGITRGSSGKGYVFVCAFSGGAQSYCPVCAAGSANAQVELNRVCVCGSVTSPRHQKLEEKLIAISTTYDLRFKFDSSTSYTRSLFPFVTADIVRASCMGRKGQNPCYQTSPAPVS